MGLNIAFFSDYRDEFQDFLVVLCEGDEERNDLVKLRLDFVSHHFEDLDEDVDGQLVLFTQGQITKDVK